MLSTTSVTLATPNGRSRSPADQKIAHRPAKLAPAGGAAPKCAWYSAALRSRTSSSTGAQPAGGANPATSASPSDDAGVTQAPSSQTCSPPQLPQLPPQQVVVGLSLFLTLFVMGPTLSEMNEVGLQPLLANEVTFTEAAEAASLPLKDFMLDDTREGELELFLDASGTQTPIARDEVPLNALIPAFVLSELKSAFILGFIIFVPFMVIDLVVSAILTSLGMMMLPPTFVSLPLKLLLFILLDGWTLVVGTLLQSYH